MNRITKRDISNCCGAVHFDFSKLGAGANNLHTYNKEGKTLEAEVLQEIREELPKVVAECGQSVALVILNTFQKEHIGKVLEEFGFQQAWGPIHASWGEKHLYGYVFDIYSYRNNLNHPVVKKTF